MKISVGLKCSQILLAFSLISPLACRAETGNLGLGFVLGDPTALSTRYNLSSQRAFDAQVAFTSHNFLLVYGDYLLQFHGLLGRNHKFLEQLTPYMGAGLVGAFATRKDHDKDGYFDQRDDSLALAVRIPFGLEWRWDRVPFGIGAELAPGIVVIPSTEGFLQAGITLRYYF